MKNVKWSVYQGSRHVDSGTCLAESDREVLRRLLARDLGDFSPVPEKCYRVTAGDCVASTYGDEFERTCGAVGDPEGLAGEAIIEETALSGGYLFDDPRPSWDTIMDGADHVRRHGDDLYVEDKAGKELFSCRASDLLKQTMAEDVPYPVEVKVGADGSFELDIKNLGPRVDPAKKVGVLGQPPLDLGDLVCPKGGAHDMNGEYKTPEGYVYPKCLKCGKVADQPCRIEGRDWGSYARSKAGDPDRAREDYELKQQIMDLIRVGAVEPEEAARLWEGVNAGATLPEIHKDHKTHRLMELRDSVAHTTTYACSRCGKRYMLSDAQMIAGSFDPRMVVHQAMGECRP